LAGRNRRPQLSSQIQNTAVTLLSARHRTATNYSPLVINSITLTAIMMPGPTANLRSSIIAHGMMNETENREFSIAAITVGLVLFFGSVSLPISYFAVRTGLLATSAPAQRTLAAFAD
jgi:hypothetical protein